MESCELRLALDELCTDVGGCSVGSRCWRRTSAGSRSDLPARRGSAMADLLKAPAFRQYSCEVKDFKSMSRQNLVEILKASLVNAAKHDFSTYIDSRQQLGFSTRRYFSHDRDFLLTSSGEDSPDDDVIRHLLQASRAWNSYRTFRMPTFAEFLAESVTQRRRSRSTLRRDNQKSNLKVSQGQERLLAVGSNHLVPIDVATDGVSCSNSTSRPLTVCIDNTVSIEIGESGKTRKPCCRKQTARCRSCSFQFKVRRRHSLQV